MTNTNINVEGYKLPSSTSNIEILLNRIKIEIEKLEKTTEATLLLHDGKIAELYTYIKDNLDSSLTELLDELKYSGELDGIITSSLVNNYTELTDKIYPIGDVKRYGAVGDGITDDTNAFQSAISEAIEHNMPLVADYGKYLISENLSARYIRLIDIKGEIITNNDSVLEVGGSSTDGSGYNVSIRKIKNLKVVGVKNSIFNVDYCEKLHLYANGDNSTITSIGYCQFYGAYAKEIVLESAGSVISWINENVFRIKRVDKVTMGGNYAHNNNRFEHINFEKGTLNLGASRNNYISARGEGGVTINSSNESESNFLEKEYYYRHYFAYDIEEDENTTYSYYHVNTLQDQETLLKLDSNSKEFPIPAMKFNEAGKFTGNSYHEIFHSNLVKIDKTFALKVKSDAKNLRVQLKFYDENKNPIITEVDNFTDGRMSFAGSDSDWLYMINANVDNDAVCFFPGEAKYVEYRVIFGNDLTAQMSYVLVELIKMVNTSVHISNSVAMNVYTSLPTDGYFKKGTMLYGANPKAGASVGVICVESGTPGVWKNFGAIAS